MSNVLFDSDPALGGIAREAAQAAIVAGNRVLTNGNGIDGESYFESEFELDSEYETLDPEDAAPSAMVMDKLARDAANARTDGEAFAFLAPLAKLAIKSAAPHVLNFFTKRRMPPGAAQAIKQAEPAMTAAYQGAAQVMRRRGRGKLLMTLGRVARRAAGDIATQIGNGANLNAQQILRIIAKHIGAELSNPQRAQQDLRAAAQNNQRFRSFATAQ